MFGDIGDYVDSTFKEIGHHPLQALGALFGVPGYDPAIGGTFNNHKGGALLSPTGNFTSSSWDEMKADNPNHQAGLQEFGKVNKVADIIAPLIAGGYAAGGSLGGEIGSMFGGSGGAGAALGGADGAGASLGTGGMGGLFGTSAGMTGGDVAGASVGSTSGLGSAGLFGTSGIDSVSAGTAGLGSGAESPGLWSRVTNLFGSSNPQGGATGLNGWWNGSGSLGDSGMTGTVSGNGSGMGSILGDGTYDYGNTLGTAPTGLFSGLNPGGGMGATQSGALGGGLSGEVAGGSSVGGASMGGFGNTLGSSQTQQQLQQMMKQQQQQQQQHQYAPGMGISGSGNAAAAIQALSQRLAQVYGVGGPIKSPTMAAAIPTMSMPLIQNQADTYGI
ncbi:hypothetical protein [Paraburkholderia terrae]|uniref:hypothetical protein n=1 Tax=Paraburkholderia terrae TaxID=311230 RepID=UPI00206B16D4|nr:hypothetical protein [Paraburkholderia terrae]BDC37924.1 hypothetical protein PTKU15_12210 [Paraburkholderia terrae]